VSGLHVAADVLSIVEAPVGMVTCDDDGAPDPSPPTGTSSTEVVEPICKMIGPGNSENRGTVAISYSLAKFR
jgi:hypothetical protein